MIRWGIIAIGLYITATSYVSWVNFVPVTREADPISVEQAVALTNANHQVFVEIDGGIDLARRVYHSGIASPAYAAHPPQNVQELFSGNTINRERVMSLLGSVVTSPGPLDTRAVVIERVQEETDTATGVKSKTVTGQRILAPLQGSEAGIFIMSPELPALAASDAASAAVTN